jgi:hypothetical protein
MHGNAARRDAGDSGNHPLWLRRPPRRAPLTDLHPSDVDVLVLFDHPVQIPDHNRGDGALREGLTRRDHTLLSAAVVQALIEFPEAARDINLTGALTTFAGWDPAFVERITQDSILLWSRGPLPAVLAPMEARQVPTINP